MEDNKSKPAKEVELTTSYGVPIGVTVTFKTQTEKVEREKGETEGQHKLRTIAKNISGWTTLYVDGEKVTFSQERAVALMQRYPHFAKQLGKA
ncbi:hypothetical protein FPY71_07235 [Aureimonas fodinaquatilis]|uniref:Uncharacterized protein n=1 Tax=Aureimonas fodinaquatilis TaxID=2565783 RepID=A0A5B0DXM5_9HYPH|nr:hypothetical protein [Aureimonas fodinaquatilis]KAA0970310.1 hypothetical protein FPY71_07235 [Aureimonas fodinaquatilis]